MTRRLLKMCKVLIQDYFNEIIIWDMRVTMYVKLNYHHVTQASVSNLGK